MTISINQSTKQKEQGMKQWKTYHIVWAISAMIGAWVAGYIGALSYNGLGVIGGILAGVIVAATAAILIAIVLTIDSALVERAQRPAPKHGRKR
jgi:hypothetical protein